MIDKRLRGYGKDAIPSYYKVIDKRLRGYGKNAIPSYYKYRKKAEFPIPIRNSAFLFVCFQQANRNAYASTAEIVTSAKPSM